MSAMTVSARSTRVALVNDKSESVLRARAPKCTQARGAWGIDEGGAAPERRVHGRMTEDQR